MAQEGTDHRGLDTCYLLQNGRLSNRERIVADLSGLESNQNRQKNRRRSKNFKSNMHKQPLAQISFCCKIRLQPSTSKLTWGGNKHRHCIATFVLLASFAVVFQWPIVVNRIGNESVDFWQLIIGSDRQKVNCPFSNIYT